MYLWLTIVKSAKEGDEEAQQTLEAENALRAQAGRMSVEQELLQLARVSGIPVMEAVSNRRWKNYSRIQENLNGKEGEKIRCF